ncbi:MULTISPECIES: hypothetical protein [Rhizobium]|uniref:Uncharacterized protein n=1 Tax=Rhizobium phaseoli TaxID=396 RepID=A0A7T0EGE3_9HYPH|nr:MULTISPECIES: hypothetical protein [Rhizobium]MDE8762505.1 hypothetical protein [Rhizobium sp. CBK13]NKE87447.1 hypothetical protein [Rhizobium phaseoli]NKF14003.1 hypothetical protein [Rhizobium phaseoli]QPK11206.1 hypothetical protein HER27_005420 [Rhizobium phaseoli]
MRDDRDANMVSQFSMEFPHIFSIPPTNHAAEIMSTILTYFLVTVTCGKSYPPRFWMFGISLDADTIRYRSRSVPNLLLDGSHIKGLFL